ncbi:MAG: PAS domain S-box protein [Proteobacteria bacterium]|nr:PAS domain S-box protein [Pseudomonadota bacterium]
MTGRLIQETLTDSCYKTILQTMHEGVFVADLKGKIIFANRAMEELTGFIAGGLVGSSCSSFMFCVCEDGTDCIAYSQKIASNHECQIKHKNGRNIPVLKNAQVLMNQEKKVIGVVETLTDISKLKTLQERLNKLKIKDRDRNSYRKIVGKGPRMTELFDLLKLASTSNSAILIHGETGTGKELVADALHKESLRKKNPLVKVNCSALSDTLLESELFGHAKGAFTGAIHERIGRFELAHKGTLFLDEISEISPLIQLKLLRFLQEKEYERVGESKTRKSDVRIISATNKDLFALVNQGLFREDLYYRLKVFPLYIPPLRDRKEDIGILIDHFINKYNLETGNSISGTKSAATSLLMDYDWPGNIRELENAIEHAFVIRNEGEIEIFDLPIEIRKSSIQIRPSLSSEIGSITEPVTYRRSSVDEKELRELLHRFKWKQSAVAKYLKVNRTTVWRLVKKYNL